VHAHELVNKQVHLGNLSNPNTNKARTFRWQKMLQACESGGSSHTSAAARRREAPRGM